MKRQKGFTLIELLVVIAIIGLLATIAAVALNNARTSSRDTKRLADIKQVQTGLELSFNQNNSYPFDNAGADECEPAGAAQTDIASLITECPDGGGSSIDDFIGGIANIADPSSGAATACLGVTSEDCDYSYASPDGTTYTIRFYLEESAGGFAGGPMVATPAGIAKP